jgi:hypothetical protein
LAQLLRRTRQQHAGDPVRCRSKIEHNSKDKYGKSK